VPKSLDLLAYRIRCALLRVLIGKMPVVANVEILGGIRWYNPQVHKPGKMPTGIYWRNLTNDPGYYARQAAASRT
jgi:hypothetical protein